MGSHLELCNLNKYFGGVQAVKNVSLQINRGELVTFLGPSGCGKTTTLHMIAGFHIPESGSILLNGQNIAALPPYKRKTPMVFQEYAIFPHLSIYENIAYGLKIQHDDPKTIKQKVTAILEQLGLPDIADRFPNQLSGGQQQRIALARALVLDPEVLLLDEPLSNLDAKLRVKVRYEIKQLQSRLNITMIYVTHDQEEALSISDRVAVMNQGIVEQFGTPWDIYFKPVNHFVAGFVGESNFLAVRVLGSEKVDGSYHTRLQWQERNLSLVGEEADPAKGMDRTLLLRPESINLSRQPESAAAIPGIVKQSSFLGAITRYWIDIGGHNVIADDSKTHEHGIFEGDVYLDFIPGKLHLI